MLDLRKKRKSIEVGHFEAWLTEGRGSFHFENLSWLRATLEFLFGISGLVRPGERNALSHRLSHHRLVFPGLPAHFDGFRILHLSDLHIDALAGLAESICTTIEDLHYDLCVLTGDYRFEIYGPYHSAQHGLEKLLATIRAPYGVVGVLGNHDFGEIVPWLEERGVTMLLNGSYEVHRDGQSIWIAGVDDPHYYGCDDLDGALQEVPPEAFKILAVHSPELYREAEQRGISLYLCGHTHAGQIRLPWIGPLMVNARCPRRMAAGLWRFGGMSGFTSAGAGSSMVPVRFGCPPEVTLIELRVSG